MLCEPEASRPGSKGEEDRRDGGWRRWEGVGLRASPGVQLGT